MAHPTLSHIVEDLARLVTMAKASREPGQLPNRVWLQLLRDRLKISILETRVVSCESGMVVAATTLEWQLENLLNEVCKLLGLVHETQPS